MPNRTPLRVKPGRGGFVKMLGTCPTKATFAKLAKHYGSWGDVYGRSYLFVPRDKLKRWEVELVEASRGSVWAAFTLTGKMATTDVPEIGTVVSLINLKDRARCDYAVMDVSINQAVRAAKVGYAILIPVADTKEETKKA